LFSPRGGRLRARHGIPWVRFGKGQVGGKLEMMRPHPQRQAATGVSGIAAITMAEELQRVSCSSSAGLSACPWPGVHQDLHLLPVSGEDLDQRARRKSCSHW
jgi:hypothetical protein